ncbi:hypothetical protein V1508DRAFT_392847 [Lipomyces doorenjongii]|uniref:uncharacterized protein n=1 Tax=Lipomyces doorenjongii TaxID=383834 RepID=UPI0034CFDEBE
MWRHLFIFVISVLVVFPSTIVRAGNIKAEPPTLKCSGLETVTKTAYRDVTTTKEQTRTVTSIKITSVPVTKTVSVPSFKSVTVDHYHTITKSIIVPTTIRKISTSTYTAKYTTTTTTTATRIKEFPSFQTVNLVSLKTIDHTETIEDRKTVTKSVTVSTTLVKVSVVTDVVSSTLTSTVIQVSPTTRTVTFTTTSFLHTATVTDSVTLSASTVTATVVPSCRPICAQLVANPSFESLVPLQNWGPVIPVPALRKREPAPVYNYFSVESTFDIPGGAHSGDNALVSNFVTNPLWIGMTQSIVVNRNCYGRYKFQAFAKSSTDSCIFVLSVRTALLPHEISTSSITFGGLWGEISSFLEVDGNFDLIVSVSCTSWSQVWLDDVTVTMADKIILPHVMDN